MYFDSIHDLIVMASHGSYHGPYVWGAYGVALVILTSLVAQPLMAKKRFIRQQKNELKRLERSQNKVGGDSLSAGHSFK